MMYRGMGWIGVIAVGELLEVVGTEPVLWLLGGGALYTVGTAFYVWRGQRYHHAVWHVFVLLGTACHFVAVSGAIR